MKKALLTAVTLLLCLALSACTVTVKLTEEERGRIAGELNELGLSFLADEIDAEYTFEFHGDEGSADVAEPEEPAPETMIGLPNPIHECSSLDEINEKVGVFLVHPPVMGVTDETFCTIDSGASCIAEYEFHLVGYDWFFRAAPFYDSDISGVYINAKPAFSGMKDGIEFAEGEGYKLARYATIDGQYVLGVKDDGDMDAETFRGIADELRELTDPAWTDAKLAAYYASLAGSWADEFTERANMDITADGSNGIKCIVHWSSSASEADMWELTGRISEDGLIYYTDCVHSNLVFTEAGETVTVISENGAGFFSPTPEGKLAWNGAAESDCTDCVFVKYE